MVRWGEVISVSRGLAALNIGASKQLKAVVKLKRCEDPSHIPKNHGIDSPLTNHQDIYPSIEVRGSNTSDVVMALRWVGHLQLPDLNDSGLGNNEQATPKALRGYMEEFRKGAAEFIAPGLPPGRLIEMNCFDPNRCSCLHYSGSEKLPHGWRLTPLEEIRHPSCRTYPDRQLTALKTLQRNGSTSFPESGEKTGGHYTWALPTANTFHGQAGLIVDIDPCPGTSRCLQVGYNRYMTVARQGYEPDCMTANWFEALDPDSYGLQDDKESFGVLWCRQRGCRNYYRYTKRTLVPIRHSNVSCHPSCPI